jgi:hypothetical protein
MKKKPSVKTPVWVVKKSKQWYQDTITGNFIHVSKIGDFLEGLKQLHLNIK